MQELPGGQVSPLISRGEFLLLTRRKGKVPAWPERFVTKGNLIRFTAIVEHRLTATLGSFASQDRLQPLRGSVPWLRPLCRVAAQHPALLAHLVLGTMHGLALAPRANGQYDFP